MARHLNLPTEVLKQRPTTDTYSLEQTQEEFFFQIPLQTLDLILFGLSTGSDFSEISSATGFSDEDLGYVLKNIERKRKTTASLHLPPLSLVGCNSASFKKH